MSLEGLRCLAIDLEHFTVVGKILIATYRLYSDNLFQEAYREASKIKHHNIIRCNMTLKELIARSSEAGSWDGLG